MTILPTGKIVTGQRAMKIEDYLETRHHRGLHAKGSGEPKPAMIIEEAKADPSPPIKMETPP